MGFIDIAVGVIALAIAIWALNLQRKEIIKNGRIQSLIHTASLLQERIDFLSKIIDDCKDQGKPWEGHATNINNELRPLKEKVNIEFLNLASKYDGVLHENEIRKALKLNKS